MHVNLFLGACVAGLSLASANVARDRKHHNPKTKWVTDIKTVQRYAVMMGAEDKGNPLSEKE